MFDEQLLNGIGIYEYGHIPTTKIVFGDEIKKICESNGCRLYGTSWACPPAVETVEECKNKCLSFHNAMVFSSKYYLEDSFDIERMYNGHKQFKEVCDKLYFLIKDKYSDSFQ